MNCPFAVTVANLKPNATVFKRFGMLHQQTGDCAVADYFFLAADERRQFAGGADVPISVLHEVRDEANDVGKEGVRRLPAAGE